VKLPESPIPTLQILQNFLKHIQETHLEKYTIVNIISRMWFDKLMELVFETPALAEALSVASSMEERQYIWRNQAGLGPVDNERLFHQVTVSGKGYLLPKDDLVAGSDYYVLLPAKFDKLVEWYVFYYYYCYSYSMNADANESTCCVFWTLLHCIAFPGSGSRFRCIPKSVRSPYLGTLSAAPQTPIP
jgi:hypothetical protein